MFTHGPHHGLPRWVACRAVRVQDEQGLVWFWKPPERWGGGADEDFVNIGVMSFLLKVFLGPWVSRAQLLKLQAWLAVSAVCVWGGGGGPPPPPPPPPPPGHTHIPLATESGTGTSYLKNGK